MQNKTVLITCADSEVGKDIVKRIGRKGAHIIMGCIDAAKAVPVRDEIIAETDNSNIEIMQLNLSSLSNIRIFAAKFTAKHSKLDVLINNAVFFFQERLETEDYFEKTNGVNYFGTYLLTHLLLPVIAKAEKARIINITSKTYKKAKFNPVDLHTRRNYKTGEEAYSLSMLAIVLFTKELAEQLQNSNISVKAMITNHALTDLLNTRKKPKWWQTQLIKIPGLVRFLSKKDALTCLYLAFAEEIMDTTETFFLKQKPVQLKSKHTTHEIQKQLWNLTKQRIPSALFCGGSPRVCHEHNIEQNLAL